MFPTIQIIHSVFLDSEPERFHVFFIANTSQWELKTALKLHNKIQFFPPSH